MTQFHGSQHPLPQKRTVRSFLLSGLLLAWAGVTLVFMSSGLGKQPAVPPLPPPPAYNGNPDDVEGPSAGPHTFQRSWAPVSYMANPADFKTGSESPLSGTDFFDETDLTASCCSWTAEARSRSAPLACVSHATLGEAGLVSAPQSPPEVLSATKSKVPVKKVKPVKKGKKKSSQKPFRTIFALGSSVSAADSVTLRNPEALSRQERQALRDLRTSSTNAFQNLLRPGRLSDMRNYHNQLSSVFVSNISENLNHQLAVRNYRGLRLRETQSAHSGLIAVHTNGSLRSLTRTQLESLFTGNSRATVANFTPWFENVFNAAPSEAGQLSFPAGFASTSNASSAANRVQNMVDLCQTFQSHLDDQIQYEINLEDGRMRLEGAYEALADYGLFNETAPVLVNRENIKLTLSPSFTLLKGQLYWKPCPEKAFTLAASLSGPQGLLSLGVGRPFFLPLNAHGDAEFGLLAGIDGGARFRHVATSPFRYEFCGFGINGFVGVGFRL